MAKASPNLEERLAKIDIGYGGRPALHKTNLVLTPLARRSPRKKLGSYTQPHPTPGRQLTPSKEPFLSTARRAEAREAHGRNKSFLHMPVTPSKPSLVNTSATTLTTPSDQTPGKKARQHEDIHTFSFMKETSSSAMKKSVNSTPHAARTPHIFRQVTPGGHSREADKLAIETHREKPASQGPRAEQISGLEHLLHVPKLAPQRRLDYKRRPSTARRSNDMRPRKRVVSAGKQVAPADITNYHIPVPTSKFQIQLPTSSTVNFTQDKKVDLRPLENSHRSASSQNSLKLLVRASSTPTWADAVRTDYKVKDLTELFRLVHKKDKLLFEASNGDVYREQPAIDAHTLGDNLDIYEKGEVLRQSHIYYVAPSAKKHFNVNNGQQNYGFDDSLGNYKLKRRDHINYRYEVGQLLGQGSFGNVVLCKDHKFVGLAPRNVAVKVVKNNLEWTLQAVNEVKVLKHLNNTNECQNVLQYLDHFHFRGHMCIVSELLSINLFTLLEMTNFRGLSLDLVSTISQQALRGLAFVHQHKIIHCDIKPENIMIKLPHDFDPDVPVPKEELCIKIIDYGSSCYHNEVTHTYIQSRFYRAPEVVMGVAYTTMIDIWSLGCVVVELFTGTPLFLGKNELEQLGLIIETLGCPPRKYIQQTQRETKKKRANRRPASTVASDTPISKSLLLTLFDTDGKLNLQFLNMRLLVAQSDHGLKKNVRPNSKPLDVLMRLSGSERRHAHLFTRFVRRIFCWDPSERALAAELLDEEFTGASSSRN